MDKQYMVDKFKYIILSIIYLRLFVYLFNL